MFEDEFDQLHHSCKRSTTYPYNGQRWVFYVVDNAWPAVTPIIWIYLSTHPPRWCPVIPTNSLG